MQGNPSKDLTNRSNNASVNPDEEVCFQILTYLEFTCFCIEIKILNQFKKEKKFNELHVFLLSGLQREFFEHNML